MHFRDRAPDLRSGLIIGDFAPGRRLDHEGWGGRKTAIPRGSRKACLFSNKESYDSRMGNPSLPLKSMFVIERAPWTLTDCADGFLV